MKPLKSNAPPIPSNSNLVPFSNVYSRANGKIVGHRDLFQSGSQFSLNVTHDVAEVIFFFQLELNKSEIKSIRTHVKTHSLAFHKNTSRY